MSATPILEFKQPLSPERQALESLDAITFDLGNITRLAAGRDWNIDHQLERMAHYLRDAKRGVELAQEEDRR